MLWGLRCGAHLSRRCVQLQGPGKAPLRRGHHGARARRPRHRYSAESALVAWRRRGDEADRIRAFKDALGLADEDAAPVHIDAGRRLMRSRLEAGTRGADVEQRRALQKLVYVSALVFGDQKAAFLLPWRRVFGMSDAQLYIARRDNARALFRSLLDARAGGLPVRAPRAAWRVRGAPGAAWPATQPCCQGGGRRAAAGAAAAVPARPRGVQGAQRARTRALARP